MAKQDFLTGKKHHKLRTILIVVGIVAAVIGITFWKDVLPGSLLDRWFRPASETEAGVMTAQAVVTDVEQIYATSGSITSNDKETVNAESSEGGSTTGYVVSKVNVAVGDTVEKGDVLFTLDMSQSEAKLETEQKKLELQQSANEIDTNAASRKYGEAQETSGQQNATDTRKLQQSADDVDWSIVDDSEGSAAVKYYIDEEEKTKIAYEKAFSTFQDISAKYNTMQADSDTATYNLSKYSAENPSSAGSSGSPSTDSKFLDLVKAQTLAAAELANIKNDYTNAQTEMTNKKTAYDTATATRKTAESTLSTNDKAITSTYRALLDQADTAQTNSRTTYEAEQSQADAVAKQQIANETTTLDSQQNISQYQAKIALNEVVSPIRGIITAVNVLDGQIYSGQQAIVVQNTDTMKATADIPEAKIADIKEGTRVRVTTSATGSEALEGTVCFSSPVPTTDAANSSSGSSQTSTSSAKSKAASYRVDIDLGDTGDRLRIGMSSQISFILASNYNTLAVPKTCVNDDGMGGKYVLRVTGDGSDTSQTEQVAVETGAEGDYYIAITGGGLNEGDTVIDNGEDIGGTGGAGGTSGMLTGVY
jgi:multidrug efflux pump subunit AcrA (membrane-fusion protein)